MLLLLLLVHTACAVPADHEEAAKAQHAMFGSAVPNITDCCFDMRQCPSSLTLLLLLRP